MASDKASRASASPRGSIVKLEPGPQSGNKPSASINATLATANAQNQQNKRDQQQQQQQQTQSNSFTQVSPLAQQNSGHAASMGGASGVPESIDEGVEPE